MRECVVVAAQPGLQSEAPVRWHRPLHRRRTLRTGSADTGSMQKPCRSVFAAILAIATQLPGQSDPELAIRVGSDGLTQAEFDVYKKRAARKHRTSWRRLPAAVVAELRENAIDDEVIFQTAVKSGALRAPDMKRTLVSYYESSQTTAKVSPRQYTAAQIQAFYDSHRGDFRSEPEIEVAARVFPKGTSKRDIDTFVRAARTNAAGQTGWKQAGWARPGERFRTPLTEQQTATLFDLRKGQLSRPLVDSFGTTYVFWVKDTKPARQLSLRECRAKVVNHMIRKEQRQHTKTMNEKLGGGRSGNLEEQKLEAAIAARIHRQWHTRQRIINTYVNSQKVSKAQLSKRLRPRFRVATPPR